MPKNKIIKKEINDKFYTNFDVAKKYFNKVKCIIKDFNIDIEYFIEPSAGGGAFSSLLSENDLAFDLVPETEYNGIEIVQKDWFTFDEHCLKDGNFCLIGNPPFGTKNDLSKKFIKHAMQFRDCKMIAMVLPEVFDKLTTQKIFNIDWKLLYSDKLPKKSFLLNNVEYHVPCVFQVWVLDINNDIDVNYREVKLSLENPYIEFCDKSEATHYLFGAAPQNIIDKNDVLPNNRGYYFKCISDEDFVLEKIKNTNWKLHGKSSVKGGVFWLTKQEIVKILTNGD